MLNFKKTKYATTVIQYLTINGPTFSAKPIHRDKLTTKM